MLVRLLPIKEQPNLYLTNLYRRRLAQSLRRVSNPIGQTLLQGLHRLVRLCPAGLYPEQCNRIRLPVGLVLSRYHHNRSPIRQWPVLSCRVPKRLCQHLIRYRISRVNRRQSQCYRDLNRLRLSQRLRRRKEGLRLHNNRDSIKGSIGNKMRVLRLLWLWTTARPFAISWL